MFRRLLTISLLLVLMLRTSVCVAESPTSPPNTYPSPDRTLRALVVALPNAPYGLGESRIEIRSVDNDLMFSHSFGSEDGEHGFGVAQAAWTPDSQFFVFSMLSSGGHQPWHAPTYFVGRHDKTMRSLDDYVGPITEPEFKVAPPDIVQTVGRRTEDLEETTFKVRLSELQKQKLGSAPANPRMQRPVRGLQ